MKEYVTRDCILEEKCLKKTKAECTQKAKLIIIIIIIIISSSNSRGLWQYGNI